MQEVPGKRQAVAPPLQKQICSFTEYYSTSKLVVRGLVIAFRNAHIVSDNNSANEFKQHDPPTEHSV